VLGVAAGAAVGAAAVMMSRLGKVELIPEKNNRKDKKKENSSAETEG
jgi:hypothetical protein